MDIASLIGLLLASGLILGSIMLGKAPFSAFVDLPSGLVVIGGAMAAALICFPLKTILSIPMVVKKVFLNKAANVDTLISEIVTLSETARRDGLLALESKFDEVNNPFVLMGIQMVVDGTRPEVIEDILRTEIDSIATRHKDGKSVMDQMGRFAPAYGMIGTLMGLIMMLSDMSDPSGIGAGMAVALITTLYGAIIANVVFIPFAEKLGFLNKQEMVELEIAVRGVMAIQAGESPTVIKQKLNTFLPPKVRRSPGGCVTMVEEEDDGGGIPEWVVTFGDMMSLLLTFFIMLVSLSEIKEEKKYQALVESVRRKFGHDTSQASMAPGRVKPRNSRVSKTATLGRARKLDIMKGGNRVQAPIGEFNLVHEIRPNHDRSNDAKLVFDEFAYELTDEHKNALQTLAQQVGGKPQKLDIRGHSTYRPVPPEIAKDQYDLAAKRAEAVKRFLVDELHVEERRVRMSVAGPHEPLYVGDDPQLLAENPRVEVHVLSEFVQQFRGSSNERKGQVTTEGAVDAP